MEWIDGKALATRIRKEVKGETETLITQGVRPGLAVILVGDDPASAIYVRNKEKACEEVGFLSEKYVMPADVTEEALLQQIEALNGDPRIDGILVQLPLPKHLNEDKVIDAIAVEKDVDGFSPMNMGNLIIGKKVFVPCTPQGIMALIAESGMDLTGKKAVVIGRSNIVGKPVAFLLLAANATVTICHSKTKNLIAELQEADVIVVAIGRQDFLKPNMVKDGAVIIDVGINRGADGKVHGDCDQQAFVDQDKACQLTPVPGGVGPMTITMLLQNTLQSAKMRLIKEQES